MHLIVAVEEVHICAIDFVLGSLKQTDETLLELLYEERRRHYEGEHAIFKSVRPDVLEPCIEDVLVKIVFDESKTIVPELYVPGFVHLF